MLINVCSSFFSQPLSKWIQAGTGSQNYVCFFVGMSVCLYFLILLQFRQSREGITSDILNYTKCFVQSQQYQTRYNYVVYYILMAYVCQFQNGKVHFCSSTGVQMSSQNIHSIFGQNLFWPMNKFLLYQYFVQRAGSIPPNAAFFNSAVCSVH